MSSRQDRNAAGKENNVRLTWRVITPEWAEQMLERKKSKRPVRKRAIEHMVRDMAAGAWVPNGVPIIFSDRDELLDGRQRLQSVIQAKTAILSLVVYNIPEESWETINSQRTRKLADSLEIMNRPNSRSLATMLKTVWPLRSGHYTPQPTASDHDLLGLLGRHMEMEASLAFANRAGRPAAIRLPVLASLHFLLSRVDRAAADRFCADLSRPARLRPEDPARQVVDYLDKVIASGESLRVIERIASLVQAWNARFTGTTATSFFWRLGGAAPFPAIAGWTDAANLDVSVGEGGGTGSDGERSADDASGPDTPLDEAEVRGAEQAAALGLVARFAEITPEIARDLLERNTGNRKASPGVIHKYARDIQSGFWMINGETIKVATTGRLLDGQHRLQGVVQADTPIRTIVVEGLHEDAFQTLDRGDLKDFADVLDDRGYANAATLAAATRLLWLRENNWLTARPKPTASTSELSACFERNHDLVESLEFINRLRKRIIPAATAAAYCLIRRVDADAAREFFDSLQHGENLSRGNPVYALREKINDLSNDGVSMDATFQMALIIKAWNAAVHGKSLNKSKLTWDDQADAFPDIAVFETPAEDGAAVKAAPRRKRAAKAVPDQAVE